MLKLCAVVMVLGSLRKEFLFLGNMMEDLKINSKMSTAHSGVYVCTYECVYTHTYREGKENTEKINHYETKE